jgi:hypothetical protein
VNQDAAIGAAGNAGYSVSNPETEAGRSELLGSQRVSYEAGRVDHAQEQAAYAQGVYHDPSAAASSEAHGRADDAVTKATPSQVTTAESDAAYARSAAEAPALTAEQEAENRLRAEANVGGDVAGGAGGGSASANVTVDPTKK